MMLTADLRQFISLLEIVGFFNIVVAHQIRRNLCQSVTHFINSIIWQRHTSKLRRQETHTHTYRVFRPNSMKKK